MKIYGSVASSWLYSLCTTFCIASIGMLLESDEALRAAPKSSPHEFRIIALCFMAAFAVGLVAVRHLERRAS